MRVVVDTNVLVSGLLNADGPPGLVVNLVLARAVTALYDSRMLAEYREVLARPRLRIPAPDADALCLFIETHGERVEARLVSLPVPDPDDLPFIEVALGGAADALVTGNTRHFPGTFDFAVLSPAEFIELLADSGHADRPFRPMPITRSGKAITRGVTPLGRSTSPAFGSWSSCLLSS